MVTEDLANVMLIFNEITQNGFEPDLFINGLAEHFRNLLVAQDAATIQLLEQGDALKAKYLKQAKLVPASFLLSGLNVLNNCDINYKMAKNKRLHVEMSLIKLTYINRALSQQSVSMPSDVPATASQKRTSNVVIEKIEAAPPIVQEPEPTINQNTKSISIGESKPKEEIQSEPEKGVVYKVEKPEEIAKKEVESTEESDDSTEKQNSDDLESDASIPSLSLASIMEDVEAEENEEDSVEEVTLEKLQAAWDIYKGSTTHLKVVKDAAVLSLEEEKILVKVGSKLAQNALLQEIPMVEFLRKELKNKNLTWAIEIDETLAPKKPEKPKVLTTKEKFAQMVEVNPNIKRAITLFDLKPEE